MYEYAVLNSQNTGNKFMKICSQWNTEMNILLQERENKENGIKDTQLNYLNMKLKNNCKYMENGRSVR